MVPVKLVSYTNKIHAIKFVRCLAGLGLKEAKGVVESQLPVIIKEFPSYEGADDAVEACRIVGQDNYVLEVEAPSVNLGDFVLLKPAQVGIVSGDPNGVIELQNNHPYILVNLYDGSKTWIYKPNNKVKWELLNT